MQRQTALKRQKERARIEKQREKTANRLERYVTSQFDNALVSVKPDDLVRKFMLNTATIVQDELPKMGGSWMSIFFLAGIRVALSSLQCFLLFLISFSSAFKNVWTSICTQWHTTAGRSRLWLCLCQAAATRQPPSSGQRNPNPHPPKTHPGSHHPARPPRSSRRHLRSCRPSPAGRAPP